MNIKKTIVENETWQEDCPGVVQTAILLSYAFIKQNKHLGKKCQSIIVMFHTNDYIYEISLVKDKNCVFDVLKSKGIGFLKEKIKEWEKHKDDCLNFIEDINPSSVKKLSNEQISEMYKEFFDLASTNWSYPIMGEGTDPFSTNRLIPLLQERLDMSFDEAREIAITLCQSETKSFLDVETLGVLKISLLKGKKFDKALEEHTAKYYWMKNNYCESTVLKEDYFLKEIKEIRKKYNEVEVKKRIKHLEGYETEIKEKKLELRKKYKVDEKLDTSIKILETMSWWIDQRKIMMLKFFHVLFVLLDEVSRRFDVKGNLMRFALPDEVTGMLNDVVVSSEVLEKRKKASVYALDSDLNYVIVEGEEAKEIITAYQNKFKDKEIKGLVACVGKGNITAPVGVVMDVNKDEFKAGSVLVTSMTRPEFVPLMRKAAAIVTEEGGITCHAAIVSRELGIPCIIGTKVSTKVLKTGMIIEVDVKSGVVKVK